QPEHLRAGQARPGQREIEPVQGGYRRRVRGHPPVPQPIEIGQGPAAGVLQEGGPAPPHGRNVPRGLRHRPPPPPLIRPTPGRAHPGTRRTGLVHTNQVRYPSSSSASPLALSITLMSVNREPSASDTSGSGNDVVRITSVSSSYRPPGRGADTSMFH